MKNHCFSLVPFPPFGTPPDVKITGDISRFSSILAIRYTLLGSPAECVIPAPADMPARKHALWEETCFEFFLGKKNSARYWEFNLSPAGHWNVYRFNAYRTGMQEEEVFTSLPFNIENSSEGLWLSLELDLDPIVTAEQGLNVAVSAVVKLRDGKVTSWALIHPGPRPDFHRRDSFVITL